ncbi:MAG: metal ABC transporter permease [Oscillospiraceae bacterium]|jgi:zinc transport system permease protein|nr:metal ABC transporter permease [Oscillospiraceae bacterium]
MFSLFSYAFMVRALIVGTLIALCGGILGITVVLKRYSMLGDGLSHVAFGALAVASALNAAPLLVALPVSIAAAFLLLRIGDNTHIKGDAAIGLLSSASLAFGVIIVSVTGNGSDLNSYLFGSILALDMSDVWTAAVLALLVVVTCAANYNRIFAVTFDETFSRAIGLKAGLYNAVTALLTALTIVIGMRVMGALLISSMLIFPALSAMRVCKTYRSVTICAVVLSVFCFIAGLSVSYVWNLPAGAAVVASNTIVFLLCSLVRKVRN